MTVVQYGYYQLNNLFSPNFLRHDTLTKYLKTSGKKSNKYWGINLILSDIKSLRFYEDY